MADDPRDPSKLSPEILDKARDLLEGSDLTIVEIARALKLDPRWMAPIKRHLAALDAAAKGEPIPDQKPQKRASKEVKDMTPAEEYRYRVRQAFSVKDRVDLIKSLLEGEESSEAVKLKALELIDKIDNIQPDEASDPVPIFAIEESDIPDFRAQEQAKDIIQLWTDNWVLNGDGEVTLTVNFGPETEESAQAAVRAIKSGMNIGLRGREFKHGETPVQLTPAGLSKP